MLRLRLMKARVLEDKIPDQWKFQFNRYRNFNVMKYGVTPYIRLTRNPAS
ncbi:hypothetical protein BZY52_24890 [Enterobacter hormaechei]|nr:hypothetical protein BZY50_19810 [Enterobacter hormaechei]OUK72011.1 hypothetical protein BZY52_24890 [Enterobacter hormaechei]